MTISQFYVHAQYVQAVVWRATRPVNMADCMNKWINVLKYNRIIWIVIHFKKYLHSFIQSAMFTGRVARQTNRLFVLRMILKLAYNRDNTWNNCCIWFAHKVAF